MSMWMSDQPGAGLVRVSLIGPMGIGKTTALRSLCGALMAATDVPNLDRAAHSKEFTTVGAEFGEIDLGEECGCSWWAARARTASTSCAAGCSMLRWACC